MQRIVIPATPARVSYQLTDKGRAPQKAAEAISASADEWIPRAKALATIGRQTNPIGRPRLASGKVIADLRRLAGVRDRHLGESPLLGVGPALFSHREVHRVDHPVQDLGVVQHGVEAVRAGSGRDDGHGLNGVHTAGLAERQVARPQLGIRVAPEVGHGDAVHVQQRRLQEPLVVLEVVGVVGWLDQPNNS